MDLFITVFKELTGALGQERPSFDGFFLFERFFDKRTEYVKVIDILEG